MAKLTLLFIVIFCIVQLTLAARVPRDALDDTFESVKKTVSDTFTKENVDAFFDKLKVLGEGVKTKATELGDTIQSTASDLLKKTDA